MPRYARKTDDAGDRLFLPVPQFPMVGTEYSESEVFWVAKHGVRSSAMLADSVSDSTRNYGPLRPALSKCMRYRDPFHELA